MRRQGETSKNIEVVALLVASSCAKSCAVAECKVYALHSRLLAAFPGHVRSLLPRHSAHWWPIIEDLFLSPRVTQFRQQLTEELVEHEEFEALSMDATLRCCLPVMGQAHPRASKESKARAIFQGDEAFTRASWHNQLNFRLVKHSEGSKLYFQARPKGCDVQRQNKRRIDAGRRVLRRNACAR